MGRTFGSHHAPLPENETVDGAEPHPSEGSPAQGIPAFPAPLPGGHEYVVSAEVHPVKLAVPPPEPYYAAGMAHGVQEEYSHDVDHKLLGEFAHLLREMFRAEPLMREEAGHKKLAPVPVYITESEAGVHPLSRVSARQMTVIRGADPIPVVARLRGRTSVRILVESAAPGGIRLLSGPTGATGALLPAGTSRYQQFVTQDELWAVCDAASTGDMTVSVIEEYKVAG